MSNYEQEISKMKWSYSRLTCFEHCKYEFFLNYIVKDDEEYLAEGNYYAEVGSFVHEILEKIFKGELSPDEASEYYVTHYDDNVFYKARESTMEKTYEACADYFANVDFSWLNDYEILGVEKSINYKLCDYNFVGFIDLLLRDKSDGKIIIVDNKSSEYPFRKDGKVKAKLKDTFDKYKKQMYLYAHAVESEYGELPKELWWNHFKDCGQISKIPFLYNEYIASIDWILNTINKIEAEENYSSVIEECSCNDELAKEYFYCNNLCSFRHCCEYNQGVDWSKLW